MKNKLYIAEEDLNINQARIHLTENPLPKGSSKDFKEGYELCMDRLLGQIKTRWYGAPDED